MLSGYEPSKDQLRQVTVGASTVNQGWVDAFVSALKMKGERIIDPTHP